MLSAFRNTAIGAVALGFCIGLPLPAEAAYIARFSLVRADAIASGSVDINGLTLVASGTAGVLSAYGTISRPASLGAGVGVFTSVTTGTGDLAEAKSDGGIVYDATGYVSSTPLPEPPGCDCWPW